VIAIDDAILRIFFEFVIEFFQCIAILKKGGRGGK
jgi:hypothetical protein